MSKRDLTIGIHFSPASAVELKHRLSLRLSYTGERHAFTATLILVISRIIAMMSPSASSGLFGNSYALDMWLPWELYK